MKKPPKKLLFFTLVSLCLSTSCDVPPVQENSAETSPNDSNNKIHFDYFVYLELEDGTIFSDQEAPISWWFNNNYREEFFLGSKSKNGDIITFTISYGEELSFPNEVIFEEFGENSSINAKINNIDYSTVTSPFENKLSNFKVNIDTQTITADLEATLTSDDSTENFRVKGKLTTHDWNLFCVYNENFDARFESDFCKKIVHLR